MWVVALKQRDGRESMWKEAAGCNCPKELDAWSRRMVAEHEFFVGHRLVWVGLSDQILEYIES